MYKHIQRILLLSKVARELPQPVWMNKQGQVVDNKRDAFCFKVPIEIHMPDLCIVLDECGCNLSQEGDGRIGKEKFLAGTKSKAYSTVSTKHHHFTCVGITILEGHVLMCVVIVSGKKHDVLVEMGIDATKLKDFDEDLDIGNKTDIDQKLLELLEKHSGAGKMFPGLPECNYKGKKILGFIAF